MHVRLLINSNDHKRAYDIILTWYQLSSLFTLTPLFIVHTDSVYHVGLCINVKAYRNISGTSVTTMFVRVWAPMVSIAHPLAPDLGSHCSANCWDRETLSKQPPTPTYLSLIDHYPHVNAHGLWSPHPLPVSSPQSGHTHLQIENTTTSYGRGQPTLWCNPSPHGLSSEGANPKPTPGVQGD